MPIPPAVQARLAAAGFEYHCFISYAHTINQDMTGCAEHLQDAIRSELALSIPQPQVFRDTSNIKGGARWEQVLKEALCTSLAMVAVCAPIYFDPAHRWCGLEWAAMAGLAKKRLPGEDFGAIIPVMIQASDPLPQAVAEIQYIDFSKVRTVGHSYYDTPDYRRKVIEIVERIEQIALALDRHQAQADCANLEIPQQTAFLDYIAPSQPFPLTRSHYET
ncbi:MAG: toll/interleukin-1 receptor domain-containing protein [Chloroflexota bacterium]